MDKTCCEVKVIETDEGYRLEVKGDKEQLRAVCGDYCGTGRAASGCCEHGTLVDRDCCRITLKETSDGCEVTVAGDRAELRERLMKVCGVCCR